MASPASRQDDGQARSAGPVAVLCLAGWFGLATGLIEVLALTIWHALQATSVLGVLQMSRHYPWLIPLAHLGIFLAIGLPLGLLAIVRPAIARRVAPYPLCALSVFSLLALIPGLYKVAAAILAVGLSWRVARWVDPGSARVRKVVRAGLPLLGIVVALLGVVLYDRHVRSESRALAALPPAAPGAPNVLLIVLDTVRADHLSLYGYERDTTPNLERLARRGVVFRQARSAAPWTLPSHASLFTGRWPHELGITSHVPLGPTYPTLAEFLARHGYATVGMVGNTFFCNSWYGLARGFVHYEDDLGLDALADPGEALRATALGRWLIRSLHTARDVRADGSRPTKGAGWINDDFLRWLEAHPGRPFFAFLNYMDAHDPYVPPTAPNRRHFGLKPETPADFRLLQSWYSGYLTRKTDREIALLRDSYDDCLAYLDEQLGLLFDELERRGTLANTLVVLTADHGEQFGERGLFLHGMSLYREEVHVPLIVLAPSRVPESRSISEPVSLRDVPATIVDQLGLAGSAPFPGRSLARFWQGSGAPGLADPFLIEAAVTDQVTRDPKLPPAHRGPLTALVRDGRVFIDNPFGRDELYDLAVDPREARNLCADPADAAGPGEYRMALDQLIQGATVRR